MKVVLMTRSHWLRFDSPLGQLLLQADESGLQRLVLPAEAGVGLALATQPEAADAHALLHEALAQLQAYFDGRLRHFELPLSTCGSDFQRQVWQSLCSIPYGETCSYSSLAQVIGRPRAQRAVGAALGRNPLPIIVPCHRVVGGDGKLVGFSGGVDCKRWLLAHEASYCAS